MHVHRLAMPIPAPGAPRLAALARVAELGVARDDDPELRTRKVALTLASGIIALLATVWVGTYAALGQPLAAAIPLAYQVLTAAGLVWFARTKDYRTFRALETTLVMVLPFALQWVLGGFEASMVVSLWGLVAALGSVVFWGVRGSTPWFAAFLALTFVSTVADPYLAERSMAMPHWLHTTFYGLNVGGVALTGWLVVMYFVRGREQALAALDAEHRALLAEQDRSDRLVRNMLPDSIAARLLHTPGTIADGPADATILFADVVGFTNLADRTEPAELVGLLDRIFSEFDRLVERRGLEKIKTIGDAYMVVGGVPSPRPDHVEAVADLALELCEAARVAAGDDGLRLRMGIATGPVIAGVIGRNRLAYDLWGDAVNTAARMEQLSEPSRIQVTDEVRERLGDRFAFVERGEIEVKGKGPMRTWFLVGRTAAVAGAA